MVQLFDTVFKVVKTEGEAQQKALKEVHEKLELLEVGMKEFFPEGKVSINEENMTILDIVTCSLFGAYKVQEEVLGLTILDPEKVPLVLSWVHALMEVPIVMELTPPHDKLVGIFQFIRQRGLQDPTA